MKPLFTRSKPGAQLILYLLLLGAAIFAMVMLRQCSQAPASAADAVEASAGDTLDVAIDYSPMSMYVKGDTLGGFNYDLMRSLAKRGNLRVKFHPVVSLKEALSDLDQGLYDMLIADIPATLDFQNRYRLTEPLYLDRQVLLQHRDSAGCIENPVSSVLDLAGRHVWVVSNSPMQSRLQSLSAEIGDTIYVESVPEYNSEQLYLLTSIGEIGLSVINERLARDMAYDKHTGGKDESVDISTGVTFTQHQSWVLRNDREQLAAKIDSLIIAFKSTEAYKALCERYLLD